MRDFRRVVLWACSLCVLGACEAGAGAASSASEPQELRYLGSFGTVTVAELGEDLGYLAPLKLKWLGNVLGGPESIRALASGDTDYGGAATGSVIKLMAAGSPIQQVIASNGIDDLTWGGYYVLDNSPLQSARDLIGKKIAVNTLGAHAEFMIREYLRRGGLSKEESKQVTMVVTPSINAEQTLRQGMVDVAALSGVMRDRAVQRGGIRSLFSDLGLFGHFTLSTTVVRKSFAAEHPQAVRKLVEAMARAIEWERETPQAEVRQRMAEIFVKRKRGEDPELTKHWHSVGIDAHGGLLRDADMALWIDWLDREDDLDRAKLGPLHSLYTNQYNPYNGASAAGAQQ